MPSKNILDTTRAVVELRDKCDELKKILDQYKQQLEDMEMNLFQSMDTEGVKSFKMDGIGTVYQSTKPWTTISDIDAAEKFFKEAGVFDEIFKLQASSGRMNSFVKENFLEKDLPVPEQKMGVVVNLKQNINIRRSG